MIVLNCGLTVYNNENIKIVSIQTADSDRQVLLKEKRGYLLFYFFM